MKFKELVQIVKENVLDLLGSEPNDFRLEQATFNKEEDSWEVVVSYLVDNKNKPLSSPLAATFGTNILPYERVFKLYRIKNHDVAEILFFEKA